MTQPNFISRMISEPDAEEDPPPNIDQLSEEETPLGKFEGILKDTISETSDIIKKLKERGINLTQKEIERVESVANTYPLRVSNYYLSLIKEKSDPIYKQCIPDLEELTTALGTDDPLNEESRIPFLTHRYPDRALLLVSNTCAMYCRFCTRKRKVGDDDKNPTKARLKPALDYLREHEEIRDVVISGGDPLMLRNKNLEWILQQIRDIEHIEMVRIGTRVPCVLPERITSELCDMLKKYSKRPPIYINTHFEHPLEITEQSRTACEMLSDAGIPLSNQSVILRGINDTPEIFKELNQKLLSMKVRPYYLYQADPVKGAAHFITPLNIGLNIIKGLRGHTSGLAVPHFVIDAPGGGGKSPLIPEYVTITDEGNAEIINYQGNKFRYPC